MAIFEYFLQFQGCLNENSQVAKLTNSKTKTTLFFGGWVLGAL